MYFTPRCYPSTPIAPGGDGAPVVVAGAGPVGLALALGLARRGVTVIVVEAGDSVSFGSRAICLSRHSLDVLERLGVGERFDKLSLPWVRGRSYYRDTEVLAFDMPQDDGDVRPPMVNLSQSVAEQVLVDAVEATEGCEVRWQCRVVGCRQDDDQVVIELDTPEGPRELRAGWLVAADGARSTVRDSLGLRLKGTSYEGRYVIADIHWRSPLPTERRVWFDPPSNPGSTIILHRQPDDIWRVDYQLGPEDDPVEEIAEQRVRERITRHLDWLGNDQPWTLEWSGIYRAHSLSLDSYVHGRILFAGDAAHLVPIFGVRGLNSGLEDADMLAWTLASVVHGTASPDLLGTYAAERRAAWEQNVGQAEKSTLFMTPGTHGYETTRDAVLALATRRPVLRTLINPRQSSATHSRSSPLTMAVGTPKSGPGPGDPIPDRIVLVDTADGKVGSSVNAERGPDFALIGFDVAPHLLVGYAAVMSKRLAPAVRARALVAYSGELPVTCARVTLLDDAGGALASAFGAQPGEVFVVRPDGLVLGRYPDPDHLADIDELADHVLQGGKR